MGEDRNHLDMYMRETVIIADVVAGGRHTLVLTENGEVYSFGYGANGQLGLKNTSNKARPQIVNDLEGRRIV
jgi:alpha-tubulin suppressor-like RCC1 family protein